MVVFKLSPPRRLRFRVKPVRAVQNYQRNDSDLGMATSSIGKYP